MRLSTPILIAAATCTAFGAFAQAIPPGEEGALLGFLAPHHGEHACFRRAYDAEHLAAHPDQTVSEMEFRIAYFRWEPDDNYPVGQRNYYFSLLAKRRGETDRLTAMGECASLADGKAIGCGVDCDGGGVTVNKREDGSILVDLGGDGRIRMTPGCGEEETDAVDLTSGKDDRAFLLMPAPASQCPGYDEW